MRNGVIFLVPVPIGNLRDITLRALDILAEVPLIACEDTRKTAFLLGEHNIPIPKLVSFHKFNERSREDMLFQHLESGQNLAIVSDAGSPAISDPALGIVKKAVAMGIDVIALPGPTALIPAFSVSGFGDSRFQFLGFLPTRKKELDSLLKDLLTYPYPTVIYESVHHLRNTLENLHRVLGDRQISISREISKLFEECLRGSLREILEDYQITEKGEFVIVIAGANPEIQVFPNPEAEAFLEQNKDMKSKPLAVLMAEHFGISKNQAYEYITRQRKA
ncbi:MAG: 16S rRNA (cytidine(1402)-2'-O)-methyltransferase [Candidatus Cloacimonetes bacterium]|nr:16S rRNA (cytidine(1402)-2'-O)-methyltransferase [Candidatus Cloacimonadota bacterium]MDD4667919.1 16S rRNA (cytidine(1402)-2'-O)-methyltransferase [Candidatus Cloacimonadota bacterium]